MEDVKNRILGRAFELGQNAKGYDFKGHAPWVFLGFPNVAAFLVGAGIITEADIEDMKKSFLAGYSSKDAA